ncbi:hypothetical protein [Streptacidiphilus neutrinimicus]|uniref:hypothetical protein n=1 Tax=Streptacidiphilus neutrinimicus TaxID=105420 RepID=UPI0005AA0654|nr:hypothetical protein [Streptacidiphilus neutrinimicus]
MPPTALLPTIRLLPRRDPEQAPAATAVRPDAPSAEALRADRYSTRPNPPAARYGATSECVDGWKLFARRPTPTAPNGTP